MALQRFLATKLERVEHDYLVCRACNTQIAFRQDCNFFIPSEHVKGHGIVFHKVVNVQIDEPIDHHQLGPHTVADIHCVKCGDKLGYKYIKVRGVHVYHDAGSNYTLEDNMMKLLLDKLLWTVTPGLDNTDELNS